jgi:DNA polymerase-3 subunit alpha
MDSIALTDHGVMYGAIEFYEAAKKAGVKPIIGMEA